MPLAFRPWPVSPCRVAKTRRTAMPNDDDRAREEAAQAIGLRVDITPVSGEVLANTLAPGALAPQRRTDLANYAGIEVGDPQPRAQGMLRHRLRAREAVRGAIRAAVLAGDRPGDTVTVRPLNDCPLTHEKPAALDAGPGRQRADPLRAMERVAIHRQRQAAPAGMRRSAADLSAHTDNRAGAAPSSQHTQEMRWRPIPPSAATMRAPKCGGPRSMRSVATEAA